MILGAICARGGSKGVPRKNIRPLAGKPLIAHTIECAQNCADLDRTIISTDDPEMADVARRFGGQVPFMRPAELAQDHSNKWDVFRHLVLAYEEISGQQVDILVDLDTGVPLRTPADISGCVQQLLASQAEVVTTAYLAERNPYFNMVEIGPNGNAQIVCQPAEPIVYRQAAPAVYSLSPAVFAIRREALWDYTHWSQSRFQIYEMPRDRAMDIDSLTDFKIIESFMNL